MSPQQAPNVITVERATDHPDITHWYCCRDEDALLCGRSGKGMPKHVEVVHECVVCAAESDRGNCPRWGRCIEHEDSAS